MVSLIESTSVYEINKVQETHQLITDDVDVLRLETSPTGTNKKNSKISIVYRVTGCITPMSYK